MEYREMLHRYVGRRVCVSTFGHSKLWGELAAVNDDCLRLVNTTVANDGDDQWLSQSQYGDPDSTYGTRHAETIVHFHHIVAITCLDDDLPQNSPTSDRHSETHASRRMQSGVGGIIESIEQSSSEVFHQLRMERLEVTVGQGLVTLADPKAENGLAERMISLRNAIGAEFGLLLPPARIRDDRRLAQDEYRFYICGSEVARGIVRPHKLLAFGAESKTKLKGERTFEPIFAQPAVWILPTQREEAESAGCMVLDPSVVLITHLQSEIRRHAHDLLSLDSLRMMLEQLRMNSPAVVEEVVPTRMPLSRLHDLLSRLLEEQVSLRPLERILERIAQLPATMDDMDDVLGQLRVSIGRLVCEPHRDKSGRLPLVTLDRELSDQLRETLLEPADQAAGGLYLARFIDALRSWVTQGPAEHRDTPLVVESGIRRRLRQLLATPLPGLAVLSYSEIPHDMPVDLVSTLTSQELDLARSPRRKRKVRDMASQKPR